MAPRTGGLRINGRLTIPERELVFETARSGGPGGQNVNKVETKVTLRFSVDGSLVLGDRRKALLRARLKGRLNRRGEVLVHASRHREQARNREDARERLAELLRELLRAPKVRRRTKPTRASRERRLREKRLRAGIKQGRRERGEA